MTERALIYLAMAIAVTSSRPCFAEAPIYYPTLGYSYELLPSDTWVNSEAKAVANGGHLASILSEDENDFVWNTFAQKQRVWIGLHDAVLENEFEWSDESRVGFTNWRSGEPNNVGPFGEDFVEMDNQGRWNDEPQTSRWPGIAKYTGPVGTFNPATGHTYYVLAPTDWQTAEELAETFGGHLVSISDRDENDFVNALIDEEKWIGLTDQQSEGEFVWTDGSPLSYTNWLVGEPDDLFAADQVYMGGATAGSGAWFDANSRELHFAIVEVVDLAADFNGDNVVDASDIDFLTEDALAGRNTPELDLNEDGLVNQMDRLVLVEDVMNTYIGDSNFDGQFNSEDLVLVFVGGQYEDDETGNSLWRTGDWNGDREFSSEDFVFALAANAYDKGIRSAVSAVPEPSTFVMVATGLMLAIIISETRRKRVRV